MILHTQFKYIFLVIVVGSMLGCSSVVKRYEYPSKQQIVWPASPAKPKIKYIGSFSSAIDLGIEKGVFAMLAEFFAGSEKQSLIRPMDVVTLGEHEIFVADPGIKGIHYFNTRAHIYKQIRLTGNVAMPSPISLAVDHKKNVYVSDSALGKVFKLNVEAGIATPVQLSTAVSQPTGLAFDKKQKRFYVVDTASHQLGIYNSNWKLIKKIGKRGKGRGEFNYPTSIWCDTNGHLWVTDSLNFRIQKLSSTGKYIKQFGKAGSASGYFSRPKGVATDKFGHIYIVDSLLHTMQIFDKKSRLLLNIGQQGQDPGNFWLPTGIYIGENSKVYIADSYNQRIQVFQYIGGKS
ncbi:MAG: 6-bladed beta-propeller [Gammaproteobacteria bacterium]|nr:6-bladed beta-propeller [Gammaproteobacteria bacterium]